MKKINFKFFFKLLFCVGLLYFLLHTSQIRIDLLVSLCSQPLVVILIITILLLTILLGSFRWYLINSSQLLHLSLGKTITISYIAASFNCILPGAIGGDFLRGYLVANEIPHSKSKIFVSLILDRLFGFGGLLILGCIACGLYFNIYCFYKIPTYSLYCLIVDAVIATMFILFYQYRRSITSLLLNQALVNNIISYIKLKNSLKSILPFNFSSTLSKKCLFLSICIQILVPCTTYLIAFAMSMPSISLINYIIAISVTQLVNLIPLTPGGVGLGELAFSNLMQLLHEGAEVPFATILLAFRIISSLAYLPGFIYFSLSFIFSSSDILKKATKI